MNQLITSVHGGLLEFARKMHESVIGTATRAVGLAVCLLGIVGCETISRAAQRKVEQASLVKRPARDFTPADVGIPFTRVWVEHNGRRLEAWLVIGADSVRSNSALFICHGTGETLSDWVHVQALLRARGVTSFVFDYSGFGNSTGTPSAHALEEDALAAYKTFSSLLSRDTRRVALGFSLGSGVLLATQQRLHPAVGAIVLASAFSTARKAAVRRRFFPGMLAYLAPDSLWNNVAAIRRVKVPVLVVHSDADRAFPISMAKELSRASGQWNSLLVQHGYRHNSLYASPSEEQWRDIVAFVRDGRAP